MYDRHPYLNLNFYNKTVGNVITELPDHTGNEPKLDIPIGGSGQDIKNDKDMPFVGYMLIMKHIHHLSTDMEGKNLQYA